MRLYNIRIGYRLNILLRNIFIAPLKRRKLKNTEVTILCNNCTAGFILHDLKMRFDTPTINMFFHEADFFEFIEHLDYYILQPLIEIDNPGYLDNCNYPVAVLPGNNKYKDLELHFLHYGTFKEASEKWEERKRRIHWDKLYVIWTFAGSMGDKGNVSYYDRAQNLPIKNKVIFVNHPVDKEKFPSFYYIKGFENEEGLGVLSQFVNLKGERFYDQFDYVNWLNNG